MAKLPHFRNSKIAMNNWEPIYPELFECNITPPDIIIGKGAWKDSELIIEEILGISGLTVDIMPSTLTQSFKGTTRNFVGVVPQGTSVSFTMDFELNLNNANENFTYNAFKTWSDIQYNPLSGAGAVKSLYTSKTGLSLVNFNKEYSVFRKVQIHNIFLSAPITSYGANAYGPGSIVKMNVSFIGDYFNYAHLGLPDVGRPLVGGPTL